MKTPEFAAMVGLSVSALEKIETGQLKLSDETAFRIARETGADEYWLSDASVKGYKYTYDIFERVRSQRDSGDGGFSRWVTPVDYLLKGVLAAAKEAGEDDLASFRINKFAWKMIEDFGFKFEPKHKEVELIEGGTINSKALEPAIKIAMGLSSKTSRPRS